jgi:hypothetical protein
MWSIHQPTKCSNRWFHFTGYRAAKQQDSDLAPDSRRAPSGAYSVPDLIASIEKYLQNHNAEPKPFVWTASTDSILAKPQKLKAVYETLY